MRRPIAVEPRRAKGFRPDRDHPETDSHHRLIGAAPATLESPSLMPWFDADVELYQNGFEGCTGAALVRTDDMVVRAQYALAGLPLPAGYGLGSWMFAYKAGRLQEHVGKPEAPEDVTCLPDFGAEHSLHILLCFTIS